MTNHHSTPSQAAPHLAAGRQARHRGETATAITSFREAIRVQPDCVPAHNNLANALQAAGEIDAALSVAQQALALAPDKAVLYSNLGGLWQIKGDLDQAIATYRQALARQPDFFLAQFNLGKALVVKEDWPAALVALDAALVTQSRAGEAHLERGKVLTKLQRHHEALAAYQQALALLPNQAQAFADQGVTLFELQYYELALLSEQQAIALDPRLAVAHYNRGLALSRLNRCTEALQANRDAIALQPEYADAHWNASLNALLLGDHASGWPEYEWRWRRTGADSQRHTEHPLWTGQQDLTDKTILLHAEQGMGDCIQFCRYLPMVAARGGRVLLEVYPALARLCATLPGNAKILPRGEQACAITCDYQAPLLSLPLAFATTLATLPADTPYLRVDRKRYQHWGEQLGAKTRPRIGVVWAGNSTHQHDQERSIPLAQLLQLDDPAYQWVSLQHQLRAGDQALLEQHPHWLHLGEKLRDFAETAALIAQLDLVIGVDTAVIHLAGALGKPTWTLLHHNPDWRWLLERSDSPWYPRMRLWRQPIRGDWDSLLRALKPALAQAVAARSHHPPPVSAVDLAAAESDA